MSKLPPMGESGMLMGASSEALNASGPISLGGSEEPSYSRKPDPDSTTAIRCRTFHAKANEGSLHYLDEQINTWLEKHGYVAKFSNMITSQFQAKNVETHIIVQVWY